MFHILRSIFWIMLFLCSVVLMGLTGYRIHQTETRQDFFRPGRRFWDPTVVELLVTSALATIFSIWFTIAILKRLGRGPFATYLAELISLFILWFMFLIGAAVFTHRYLHLKECRAHYKTCRILETIKAFSWICWIFTTFLIISTLSNMAFRKHDFFGPVHGRADTTTGATTHHQTREVRNAGNTGTASTTATAHENPAHVAQEPVATV